MSLVHLQERARALGNMASQHGFLLSLLVAPGSLSSVSGVGSVCVQKLLKRGVVVIMKNVPHRLRYLNPSSPVGGVVCGIVYSFSEGSASL